MFRKLVDMMTSYHQILRIAGIVLWGVTYYVLLSSPNRSREKTSRPS